MANKNNKIVEFELLIAAGSEQVQLWLRMASDFAPIVHWWRLVRGRTIYKLLLKLFWSSSQAFISSRQLWPFFRNAQRTLIRTLNSMLRSKL